MPRLVKMGIKDQWKRTSKIFIHDRQAEESKATTVPEGVADPEEGEALTKGAVADAEPQHEAAVEAPAESLDPVAPAAHDEEPVADVAAAEPAPTVEAADAQELPAATEAKETTDAAEVAEPAAEPAAESAAVPAAAESAPKESAPKETKPKVPFFKRFVNKLKPAPAAAKA